MVYKPDDENFIREVLKERKGLLFKILEKPEVLEGVASTAGKVKDIKLDGDEIKVEFENGKEWTIGLMNYKGKEKYWVVENGKVDEMLTRLLENGYKNVEISKAKLKNIPSEAYISVVDEYRAYSPQREEIKLEALEKENGKVVGQLKFNYEHTEGEKPKKDLKRSGTLERFSTDDEDVEKLTSYLKKKDIVVVKKEEDNIWSRGLRNIHKEIELKAGENILKWVDNDTEIDKTFGTKKIRERGVIKNIGEKELDKLRIVEDYLIAKGMPIIATDAVLKMALSQPLQTNNPRVKEFAKELSEEILKSEILRKDETIGKIAGNLQGVDRNIGKEQGQVQKREVKKGKGLGLSP